MSMKTPVVVVVVAASRRWPVMKFSSREAEAMLEDGRGASEEYKQGEEGGIGGEGVWDATPFHLPDRVRC